MLDVRASRRAFATERRESATDRRRRRRSEQLASSRTAEVPRCASTPIRSDGASTLVFARGSLPSLAPGSVRKRLGPARFVLGGGVNVGAELEADDQWLAASVAHVRELARKTVTKAVAPHARKLASRDRATGRCNSRRRRRAEVSTAEDRAPIDRVHAASPEEDAKQRRGRWKAELQDQVCEQRKVLSKLKVDRSLREDKLSCLAEKLAVDDVAEAKISHLVPAADKRLVVVRARLDETVCETKEMTRYADTLAVMHQRAKDALQGAKTRTDRLQVAFGTLCDEVAHTKNLLLTLEAARVVAAKQKAKTVKQLADSAAANSEKTLALQDRVDFIDPDAVDEVELQVQAVRETKRKQRQARKEAKAAEARAKEEQVAVSLALTAARRNEVEGAIRRIHAATGVDDPDGLLEKFLTNTRSIGETKRKVSAAESRLESLRDQLQAVQEEESKVFLEYNPDKERLASRTKALRPRTTTLTLAEANLSRCRDRASALRKNLLVSASQIFALLQKVCAAVGCLEPAHNDEFGEGEGIVHLEALETLLLQLLAQIHKTGTPSKSHEDNETEAGSPGGLIDDLADDLIAMEQQPLQRRRRRRRRQHQQHPETSEYGRLDLSTLPAACQSSSSSASDDSFLPSIFEV